MENGDEYTGYLYIKAECVDKIDERTILADGVEIEIDEPIIEVAC